MKTNLQTDAADDDLFAGLEAQFARRPPTPYSPAKGRVTRRKAAEKAMSHGTGKVPRRQRSGVQLTIRIPDDAKREIEVKALTIGVTVTALILRACKAYEA